ncbi:hypothetical protein ASC89_27260 [Devosia sp. Root413D1]|jgi:hypothetical protein|uniref:hypothetical protein n=1 Tax=unclassified Devosia TaxID=196773 RepID=UPI0006F69BAB|nr:hypothetical protein [Devosia sp. Root413D1]KQW74102.1 hypothetical protein ASC89_27260 [Devosia sp. Root413D1]
MTLVHQVDGAWTPIHGVQTLERMVATCTVTYHDGRQAEMSCEPYPVAETLDLGKVEQLVAEGLWGVEELQAYGLRPAMAVDVPEGKQRVGEPRYVERKNEVVEEWTLEQIPAPAADPTPAEKLAALGLTVEDLRALFSVAGSD